MRIKPLASIRRTGFTIIEVAITLGVMAIMAALALPAIDFNRYRMDANARLVQNWLMSAQSRAVFVGRAPSRGAGFVGLLLE